uniref:Uncharacterized protein n=1 Tax=Anguilla anguilla TaxID=7936 RepID=A0A0E9PSD4_ANGAN
MICFIVVLHSVTTLNFRCEFLRNWVYQVSGKHAPYLYNTKVGIFRVSYRNNHKDLTFSALKNINLCTF